MDVLIAELAEMPAEVKAQISAQVLAKEVKAAAVRERAETQHRSLTKVLVRLKDAAKS